MSLNIFPVHRKQGKDGLGLRSTDGSVAFQQMIFQVLFSFQHAGDTPLAWQSSQGFSISPRSSAELEVLLDAQ